MGPAGPGGGSPLRANNGFGQTASDGFWSQDDRIIVSRGDKTAGGNEITYLGGGSAGAKWVYDLLVRVNIMVAGTGPKGQDLNATVTANNGSSMFLNIRALGSVSGASIRYRKD